MERVSDASIGHSVLSTPVSGLNGKWATKQWRKGTDETVLSVPTLTRIPNVRLLVQSVSQSERAGSRG